MFILVFILLKPSRSNYHNENQLASKLENGFSNPLGLRSQSNDTCSLDSNSTPHNKHKRETQEVIYNGLDKRNTIKKIHKYESHISLILY